MVSSDFGSSIFRATLPKVTTVFIHFFIYSFGGGRVIWLFSLFILVFLSVCSPPTHLPLLFHQMTPDWRLAATCFGRSVGIFKGPCLTMCAPYWQLVRDSLMSCLLKFVVGGFVLSYSAHSFAQTATFFVRSTWSLFFFFFFFCFN